MCVQNTELSLSTDDGREREEPFVGENQKTKDFHMWGSWQKGNSSKQQKYLRK